MLSKEVAENLQAELKEARQLTDEAYTIRANIFHKYLKDDDWQQIGQAEYLQRRKMGEEWVTLDLRKDTYRESKVKNYERGPYRYDGLSYAVEMLLEYGGEWPTLFNQKNTMVEGRKIVFRPPYRLNQLTPRERAWHAAIPPEKEQLETFMRYHVESGLLYYVDGEIAQYEELISGPAYFIEIDGKWYARWRVISQLVLGNHKGVIDEEKNKELLDKIVTSDVPLLGAIYALHKILAGEMDKDAPGFKRRKVIVPKEKDDPDLLGEKMFARRRAMLKKRENVLAFIKQETDQVNEQIKQARKAKHDAEAELALVTKEPALVEKSPPKEKTIAELRRRMRAMIKEPSQ